MIGVVVVTHYRLAEEFMRALSLIVGERENFRAIGLDPQSTPEEMRSRIDKAVREVDREQGVLLLVDMFGGTPSNLCLSFLDEDHIEVVTGLNLPMLVKVAQLKEAPPIHDVATLLRDYGRKNIRVATDVLAGRDEEDPGP
jgi:PTS system mannose-specific IIA component